MADEQGEVSLSIEETNKLRISLGLKPLSVGPSSASVQAKEAADNYAAKRDEERRADDVRELQEKLAKSRTKRELKKKLQGKGLGEAEDEVDSTLDSLAWVEKMKKRQAELAQRKQKELEEQDQEAELAAKRSATTAGLRVGHTIDSVLGGGGEETILVLKDSTIEQNEEEGDELVSLKLLEAESTKKKLEAGKKKTAYDPAAEEHQGLLSHYDETISGPEKSNFVLGDEGTFSVHDEERRRAEVSKKLREQQHGLKGTEMTLDYTKTTEIRDYYTQEEEQELNASFKKVKRKDKKKSRPGRSTRIVDEDEDFAGGNRDGNEMDTRPDSFAYSNATASIEDVNFVDDDDLQGAIAKARKVAEKKKARVMSTTRVADEILGRNGRSGTPLAEGDEEGGMVIDIDSNKRGQPDEDEGEEVDPDLIISDTTNFVRALQTTSVFQKQQAEQARKAEVAAAARRAKSVEPDEDEEEPEIKEEQDEDRMDWESGREGSAAPSDVKVKVKRETKDGESDDEAPEGEHITEEPLVAAGLGATLSLLASRGALQKVTEEDKIKEARIRQQTEWLKQQKIKDLEKELEKKKERERKRQQQGKGQQQWEDEKTYAEEQYEERKRMRELEDKFKAYKPEINIDYVDEFGRTMNQKEAFKFLSHRFHGKGSGKMKTEKRLQRIADEFEQAAASTADTPLGMVNALHERTKMLKQPHVVLQVGNRAANQPEPTKVKPSAAQKKLKKDAAKADATESVIVDVPGGLSGQPVDSAMRERVTFGFGVKRKADAMKEESPEP